MRVLMQVKLILFYADLKVDCPAAIGYGHHTSWSPKENSSSGSTTRLDHLIQQFIEPIEHRTTQTIKYVYITQLSNCLFLQKRAPSNHWWSLSTRW